MFFERKDAKTQGRKEHDVGTAPIVHRFGFFGLTAGRSLRHPSASFRLGVFAFKEHPRSSAFISPLYHYVSSQSDLHR